MNKAYFHVSWLIFITIILFNGLGRAETKPVGFAIPFPDLSFTQVLSKEEQA
jgi:hypothetical protein